MNRRIYEAPECAALQASVCGFLCLSYSSADDYTGFDPWTEDLVD